VKTIVIIDLGYKSYQYEKELFNHNGYDLKLYSVNSTDRFEKARFVNDADGILVRGTVIDADFLVEAIKDAEIYSEILNIKAIENEGLLFSSSGQIGEMEYNLTTDDLIESNLSETSTGAYSLTFLKAILKIAPITEKLEISLKTDNPLKMIFNILEGGELSYFLAPRVEEAEFEDEDDDMDEF